MLIWLIKYKRDEMKLAKYYIKYHHGRNITTRIKDVAAVPTFNLSIPRHAVR